MKISVPTLNALCILFISMSLARGADFRFSGFVAGELRGFPQAGQFPRQLDGLQPSWLVSPEVRLKTGSHRFVLVPYVRFDFRDEQRRHFDLREAYWRYDGERWELVAGVNRVFWGVTESRHLVDIINQSDFVEDIDDEDKLGQPMVNFSLQQKWGHVSLFLLPGFRERTFPGAKGRLGPPQPVDTDAAQYESSAGRRHLDFAARYSHFIGDWDIGVSYFYGTGREPALRPGETGDRLIPYYSLIHQTGWDLQYTRNAWLWKLEGIVRSGQGKTFTAWVGGMEYTFYQAMGSADLSLLFEYLYDGRDEEAPVTLFDDDLFVATRLALNDTQDSQVLAGAVIDREHGSIALTVEFERRLGERWKLEAESRLFAHVSVQDALAVLQNDDFVSVRLSWFF